MNKVLRLYLISDSTGETVATVSKAILSQFKDIPAEEYIWQLIRSTSQIDEILEQVEKNKGIVIYTLANSSLRKYLKNKCRLIQVPCTSPIGDSIRKISTLFKVNVTNEAPGKYNDLDDSYFRRVETINFAINHDDGNAIWELNKADIVLLGVSRTSKSPTSFYLAHRGYKTANVPIVKPTQAEEQLEKLDSPLVVGLTITPKRLMQLRKHRVASLYGGQAYKDEYTNITYIEEEIQFAEQIFMKYKTPIIDVTTKAIEETAAKIINLYQEKHHLHKVML